MQTIIQADLTEMVFRGRNKAYGAYLLRQQYAANTLRGFFGSMGLVLLVVLIWLFATAGTGQAVLDVVLPPPPQQDTVRIQAWEVRQRLDAQPQQ